jgi:hypothetical protein
MGAINRRASIAKETAFCVEALEKAPTRYGRPRIFNTDIDNIFVKIGMARQANLMRVAMQSAPILAS